MKLFGQRYPEEIAKRVPPGQRLVKGWPVLHYGPIPKFDEAAWDLEVSGAVESPYTLTYGELKALGPADVQADMHCVTGWSTLDNEWTGIPFRVLHRCPGNEIGLAGPWVQFTAACRACRAVSERAHTELQAMEPQSVPPACVGLSTCPSA